MPTQKRFKRRVRARMAKTGEAYTAARHQLLRKAEPLEPDPDPATVTPETGLTGMPAEAFLVADEAVIRATGKSHAEWFAILDEWGGTGHTHTEIARWLGETHSAPGWWIQNITVAYERARGMRKPGQMADGFTVSVSRTVDTDEASALRAFTDPAMRVTWLPAAPMKQRPTRAARTARFDWPEPPSRVVVNVLAKQGGKATVFITHEQLPDVAAADRFKASWRGWADALKASLERS